MSHRTDAVQLRRTLIKEGFQVKLTGSGHWEVRAQSGERVSTFPQTPSDRRWKQNTQAEIRRWKRRASV
jgi:hypothetical protein